MELLEDLNRDYQRYRFTPRERSFLGLQGLQPVLSSNVAAVGVRNTELLIRFHNGSVYSYRGKADQYENILKSNSKGKWVWRNLRRKNAPYEKIGVIPLPDDIGVTDEDIFQEIDNRYLADLTRHVDVPVFQSFTFINGVNMQKIVVGNINVFKPITDILPLAPEQPIAVDGNVLRGNTGVNVIDTLSADPKEALKELKKDDKLNDLKGVIKEQGYDGNPILVDKETFQRQAQKTNIVIGRGYKARELEISQGFRKEMESGDFFVDNTGGAVYGRGMYFAKANVDDEQQIEKLEKTVKSYAGSKFSGLGQTSIIDVATVTDDFKAISSRDVNDTFFNEYTKKVLTNDELEIVNPYLDITNQIKDLVKQKIQFSTDFVKVEELNEQIKQLRQAQRQIPIPKEIRDKLDVVGEIAGSGDIGVKAALMGYDAVYAEEQEFYIVVNRSKLVLLDNGGEPNDSLDTIKI